MSGISKLFGGASLTDQIANLVKEVMLMTQLVRRIHTVQICRD